MKIKVKIYIASKFSRKDYFAGMIDSLADRGFEVTSSWLTEDKHDFEALRPTELRKIAERDIDDIANAEVVILDTVEELRQGAGGGREFEAGIGLRIHGEFWIVGPARNPFHFSASRRFKSWEEFLKWEPQIV